MRKLLKPILALMLCAMLSVGFAGEAFAAQAQSQAASEQSALSAPQNFAASKVSKSSVALTWDKVEGAKQYKIYSSTTADGTFKLLSTVKTSKYTHKIKLGNNTRYYVVRAVNGKDSGPLSSKLAVSLPGVTPKPTDTSALDKEIESVVNPAYVIIGLEQKYLDGLNADRAANGVPPVEWRPELAKTALLKAADMAILMGGGFDFFAPGYNPHVSPTYGSNEDVGNKYLGYPVSENIMEAVNATGWQRDYADAADLGRDQFMLSQNHRATRLNKDLKYVGVAIYYDGFRVTICEHYTF